MRLSALFHDLLMSVNNIGGHKSLRIMADLGLTLPQLFTLFNLNHLGASSVSAISRKLELSMAATSHMVERLVQSGLVERREFAEDRRQKRITISRKGINLLTKLQKSRSQELAKVFSLLSDDICCRLEKILSTTINQLEESIKEAQSRVEKK